VRVMQESEQHAKGGGQQEEARGRAETGEEEGKGWDM
jgi:hypothetical protein